MSQEDLLSLKPKEIVASLSRYIIGQEGAKKAVAVALRDRYRREQVSPDIREEIMPKNILMIGPTGVGKTEVARRIANLAQAPFVKVEATKFTEVGYVGRDVDSMIRDLVQVSVRMVEKEMTESKKEQARDAAVRRIAQVLDPSLSSVGEGGNPLSMFFQMTGATQTEPSEPKSLEKEHKLEELMKAIELGEYDDHDIEIELEQTSGSDVQIFPNAGMEEMGAQFQDMLSSLVPTKTKTRRLKVAEALPLVQSEEARKLIDRDEVSREGVRRAEQRGIVFIDEIDKVVAKGSGRGPDVSREGVQRDLLPVVEGTAVNTKYGTVKTDHMLFLAAGAFHVAKPSDLIPEFQGRFPVRVELESLTEEDFKRILVEPKNALTKQYAALLSVEGITLKFDDSGVAALARMAVEINEQTENVGARRLHTIMERLLYELSYEASDMEAQTIIIDEAYVKEQLDDIVQQRELVQYIL